MQLPSRHLRVDPLRGWSRCPAHYALRARSAGVHALGAHPYLPNTTPPDLVRDVRVEPIVAWRGELSVVGVAFHGEPNVGTLPHHPQPRGDAFHAVPPSQPGFFPEIPARPDGVQSGVVDLRL